MADMKGRERGRRSGEVLVAHVTDVGRYPQSNNDRLVGYQEALAEAGIGFDPALLIEAENGLFGGAEAVRALERFRPVWNRD